MKNNNKNRKLNFIRKKNKLRLGFISYYGYRKFVVIDEKTINDAIILTKEKCLNEFKIIPRFMTIMKGKDGDDFMLQTNTLWIKLTNKRKEL